MQKNKMKKFDYKKVLKYGLIWVGGIVSFGTNGYYCWEHDPEKKEIARQEKKNLSVLKKAEVFMAKYLALEDVEFPYENKQFDVDLENTFKTLVKNRENRDFYQDVFKPEVASLLGVQE
ncbi:MAG: hypothetical protein LBU87_06965, partial [Lactobacillales bacterium]|nr:hypothetical protein [Lactobacillales bacterium]